MLGLPSLTYSISHNEAVTFLYPNPMTLFGEAVSLGTAFFLILALLLALGFECVNGFHDTANAVATVIYTHSLEPHVAVVW